MNCQDLRKMIAGSIGKGGPFAVTAAERGAARRHFDACQDCVRWLDARDVKATKSLHELGVPAEDIAILDVRAKIGASVLNAKDAQDPEV